jgi:hypothetical protein
MMIMSQIPNGVLKWDSEWGESILCFLPHEYNYTLTVIFGPDGYDDDEEDCVGV